MHSNILLILRPLGQWDIVTAELRRVAALGRYMEPKAAVKAQWVDVDDDELRQLANVCEELQTDSIYTRYANKKVFRRTDDFWSTHDTMLRQHVKHLSDQKLLKAVTLAQQQDIPILYAQTEGTPLHITDQLTFTTDVKAMPVMCFHRHEQGISYTMKLRIPTNDETCDPQEAQELAGHITVLGHEPGLFIMDQRLLLLADGFSGKLLLPFTTKDVVEIPRRIENDYMSRFILRNVTKAEIEAEGFDISDTGDLPVPCLHTETAIDGRPLLTLRFRYGNNDYAPDSKANGRVTLTATDDGGYRFTRQMRDREKEQHYARKLGRFGRLKFDSTKDMVDWLRQNAPKLRRKGFDVVQPSDSVFYIGPLDIEQSDTWNGDWLQTDVTIVLDNGRLRVPFLELRDTILRGDQTYILPTGEQLIIPTEWLKRYTPLVLTGMPKGNGFQRHRCQLPADENPSSQPLLPPQKSQSPQLPPEALRATLRPYQLIGFQWLWQNFEAQTGCCLSDEMGLGKTLQTIALLLKYKEEHASKTNQTSRLDAQATARKPQPGLLFSEDEMRGEASYPSSLTSHPRKTSFVITPASVVHNWRNELARFAPSLSVCTYTGSTSARRDKRHGLMRFDVVITTYRTMVNDIDYLAEQQFGIVVFDESQAFKNATSQVHRAVTRIQATHRLALSGTPVENSLMELWSLMNVLNPPLLGSQRTFQQTFIAPIARQMEEERAALLRRLIKPYFLKRTKEEVLSDLPARQDEVVVCPMTDDQARLYAEELSRARNELLASPDSPEGSEFTSVRHPLSARQLTENQRFHILAAIQRLRHIANGEGKLTAIFDHLESLRGTNHKVLLFSEYVSMLERVAMEMRQRHWTYDMLTGHTHDRENVIAHFQQTGDCQFFLISLKAGGVGLNLTAADYVMLIDPWWNQAAEEQAIARAHRIGQHNPVFVYRFVSENTLEQQILNLQERKQTLIDSVMPFLDKKS